MIQNPTPNSRGLDELMHSPAVVRMLRREAEEAAARARATAPVDSGRLRGSIRVEMVETDRPVARVIADTEYAAKVSTENHFLAQALDGGP